MYYIYKIENTVNHKKYIGLTNNIERRRKRHFSDLKYNRHDNHFLQKEYNEFGVDNFSFTIEFSGDVSYQEISKKEEEYIRYYDSFHNGYNQNAGGNFGPSNGGSQLTKKDIFNILSTVDFMSRPGQVLSDFYHISRTTISRIKKGENHCEYKKEYEALPEEERLSIFKEFCLETNLISKKACSTIIVNKRKLSEKQVHLYLLNEELNRPVKISTLMKTFGISSGNTLSCILKGLSYKDYVLSYSQLTRSLKEELASLLCKQ